MTKRHLWWAPARPTGCMLSYCFARCSSRGHSSSPYSACRVRLHRRWQAPAPSAPAPTVAPVAWEEKLGWILRLEDQRLLREPNPPAPVILRPATRTEPPLVAPPQPSDLIRLLSDSEARVRRRAALAAGRVGLPAAVEPLTRLLTDEEFEVRQMAAFALGLLADASAVPRCSRHSTMQNRSCRDVPPKRSAQSAIVPMRMQLARWCDVTSPPAPSRR